MIKLNNSELAKSFETSYNEIKQAANKKIMQNNFEEKYFSLSKVYKDMFNRYTCSNNRDCPYFYIDDIIWIGEYEAVVNILREIGITEFAINGQVSTACRDVFEFQKLGCKIKKVDEMQTKLKKILVCVLEITD